MHQLPECRACAEHDSPAQKGSQQTATSGKSVAIKRSLPESSCCCCSTVERQNMESPAALHIKVDACMLSARRRPIAPPSVCHPKHCFCSWQLLEQHQIKCLKPSKPSTARAVACVLGQSLLAGGVRVGVCWCRARERHDPVVRVCAHVVRVPLLQLHPVLLGACDEARCVAAAVQLAELPLATCGTAPQRRQEQQQQNKDMISKNPTLLPDLSRLHTEHTGPLTQVTAVLACQQQPCKGGWFADSTAWP